MAGGKVLLVLAAALGVAAGFRPHLSVGRRGLAPLAAGAAGGASAELLDAIIEQLVDSHGTDQLPQVVGQNAKAISSPAFFLRIAELADEASKKGDAERQKLLGVVSETTVAVLSKMVENAESTLDDANTVVEAVVSAAADSSGVFRLPLSPEQEEAVRSQLGRFWSDCNEAFLQTLQAWISKADGDAATNEDIKGMADILRRVLQIFTAESLTKDFDVEAGSLEGMEDEDIAKKADAGVAALLDANPDHWRAETLRISNEFGISADQLLAAVQMRVQMVVLSQANGSLRQRVQAEFLRELMKQLQEAGGTSAQREDVLQKELKNLESKEDKDSGDADE